MTKILENLPTGSTIHNIELRPGAGGSLCRAAGTSATLVKNGDDGRTLLMLPSGQALQIFLILRELVFFALSRFVFSIESAAREDPPLCR